MTMTFATEAALSVPVIRELTHPGVHVAADVAIPGMNERPDLVALRESPLFLEVLELDCGIGLDGIQQAADWTPYCHVSIFVSQFDPQTFDIKSRVWRAAETLMRKLGVGCWLVAPSGRISRMVPPVPNTDPRDIGLVSAALAQPFATVAGRPGNAAPTERKASFAEAEAALSHVLDRRPRITVAKALRLIEAPRGFREYLAQQRRIQMVGGVWMFVPAAEAAA